MKYVILLCPALIGASLVEEFPPTADLTKLTVSQTDFFALARLASNCGINAWTIVRNWCHGGLQTEAVSPSAFVTFNPSLKYTCHNGTMTDPCTGNMIEQGTDINAITSGAVGTFSAAAKWYGLTCSDVDPLTGKRKIEEINLSGNNLSCEISKTDLSAVIPNLVEFDLSNNNLFGTLPPWLASIGSSGSGLRGLYLNNNNLTGSVPNNLTFSGSTTCNLKNNLLECAYTGSCSVCPTPAPTASPTPTPFKHPTLAPNATESQGLGEAATVGITAGSLTLVLGFVSLNRGADSAEVTFTKNLPEIAEEKKTTFAFRL